MAAKKDEETTRSVSIREMLDAEGNVTEENLGCAGVRYTIKSSGYAKTMMRNDLPDEVNAAIWAFGAQTLAGNVTNTARNSDEAKAKSAAERDRDQQEVLDAWWDNLKAGNWSVGGDRGEVGLSTLADALYRVQTSAGITTSVEALYEKLKAAPKEKVKEFRANSKVAVALAEINLERKRAREQAAAEAAPVPTFD